MDTIQVTLGQALLVLVGLAVVLFTVILLVVEADYLLRLVQRLARRWKSDGSDPTGSDPSNPDQAIPKHTHDEQEAR